ncbi:MAG: LysR family transcriptional regulator [Burkholderiales bacterium]|nr:LysR family transcriptional regulator [Burkholderiales bacterium]
MKLSQLRQFLAALEAGTIRQAARQMFLSQSSLTKSIHQLEEELGTPLLHRGPGGVTPTAAGQALAARARAIEGELREARNDVDAIRGAGSGEIRVSASPTVATSLLPQAVLDFKRSRPKTSFQIAEGVYPDVLGPVRTGQIDFAICLVTERPREEDLNVESLLRDRVVPAVRASHPLAQRGRLTLAELARLDLEWVIYRRGHGGRDVFERTFLAAGHRPPRSTIECTSFACVLALVEKGDYATLVPSQLLADRGRRIPLAPLPTDAPLPPWNVAVISRPRRRLSPLGLAFLRQLHQSALRSRPAPAGRGG